MCGLAMVKLMIASAIVLKGKNWVPASELSFYFKREWISKPFASTLALHARILTCLDTDDLISREKTIISSS